MVYHFAATPNEDRAKSAELARKAQNLVVTRLVLAILGNTFTFLHDLEAAELMIRKALLIDGGSAWAVEPQWMARCRQQRRSTRASSVSRSHSTSRRTTASRSTAWSASVAPISSWDVMPKQPIPGSKRALAEHPSATWIPPHHVPCLCTGGSPVRGPPQRPTALREHYPDLTVSDVQRGLPPLPQSYCDRIFDALHSVGLPL